MMTSSCVHDFALYLLMHFIYKWPIMRLLHDMLPWEINSVRAKRVGQGEVGARVEG